MKSTRQLRKRSPFSIVGRNGLVTLPPGMATFQLGQRVFFHADGQRIEVLGRPRGLVGGRIMSARIRRSVRTLEKYGPRSRR